MAQLRLTQKFAKDLKITQLKEPEESAHFLDDWFIDHIRVHRKKVAVVTHGLSRLTFLLPYYQIGGSTKVAGALCHSLKEFLLTHDYSELIPKVDELFKVPHHFCKTQNRQVVGHLNELKKHTEFAAAYWFERDTIDWDDLREDAMKCLLKYPDREYREPREYFLEMLPVFLGMQVLH